MNTSTLIGIVASVLLRGVVLFFSTETPALFVDLLGLGIVLIGTLAATFISYPLKEVMRIFGLIGTVMRNGRAYAQQDIDELVLISRIWMTGDVQDVERALEKVSNPFLRTGVQLIIDTTPERDIMDLLQWRISRLQVREHAEAQLFRTMASYTPAFGMVGTLIGLVNLMFMLGDGDMTALGQQMSLALMTTFYGNLLANLVFKPIAVQLERRTDKRIALMNMVMQGLSMMSQKRRPAFMRETLKTFMANYEDELHDGKNGTSGKSSVTSDEESFVGGSDSR